MTLFANGVSSFFKEQAIRMRRTTWKDPNILAEEIFAIFSHVPDTGTGTISIVPPVVEGSDEATLDVLELPPSESIGIAPYDLDFPDVPGLVSEPAQTSSTDDDGRSTVINTIEAISRTMVPAKVTAKDSENGTYFAVLYPLGTAELDKYVNVEGIVMLQSSDATVIPANSWTFVLRVTKLLITETLTEEEFGRVTKNTTITVADGYPRHYMQFPVWL